MAKITIDDILAAFASTTSINARFQQIEEQFQDKVLYRDNPTGEPNFMNNDLDMNTVNTIINLGAPLSSTSAARLKDITDAASSDLTVRTAVLTSISDGAGYFETSNVEGAIAENSQYSEYGIDSGTADTYVVTVNPVPTAYKAGMNIQFKPLFDCTGGAVTIDVNGIGSKAIVRQDGTAPTLSSIDATGICSIQYDGTNFVLTTATEPVLVSPVIDTGVSGTAIDTDAAMAANSDTLLASQKATKTHVANTATGASGYTKIKNKALALPSLRFKELVGTGTYTPDSDVQSFIVFMQGTMAGRRGTVSDGGGGGPAYSEKLYSTPAGPYSYSVGAVGSSTGPTAGGDTTFDTLTCTSGQPPSGVTGGAGGVATGGDFNANGGIGGTGRTTATAAGGGGGGTGTRAGIGGAGGSAISATGGGGGGTGGNAASGGTNGDAATTEAVGVVTFPSNFADTTEANWKNGFNNNSANGGNGASGDCIFYTHGGLISFQDFGAYGGYGASTTVSNGILGNIYIIEVLQ